ncbi:MAG: hypothetical protein JOZ49_10480, partial [Mycolicibacterium sp.]|nr:hypothetical protein [Mycolicibacterium sp.]
LQRGDFAAAFDDPDVVLTEFRSGALPVLIAALSDEGFGGRELLAQLGQLIQSTMHCPYRNAFNDDEYGEFSGAGVKVLLTDRAGVHAPRVMGPFFLPVPVAAGPEHVLPQGS